MHWHGGYLATGARHFPRLIPNLNTVEAVRLATVIGLFPIFREGSSHFPRLGGLYLEDGNSKKVTDINPPWAKYSILYSALLETYAE